MDLQEATLTMALLMKEEYEFYEQHAEPNKAAADGMDIEDLKELEWRRANTREFGNRLAANPYFFDVMESWVVAISGNEGVNKESMEEAAKSSDVDDLVDRASVLAASVKKHLKDNGYVICDMGAGETGWDFGIRCTENQSRALCMEMHQRYTSAIEMGLLSVSRRFAGHRLPGLYNWDNAKRFLANCGDNLLE
jgi:hypothetical protein